MKYKHGFRLLSILLILVLSMGTLSVTAYAGAGYEGEWTEPPVETVEETIAYNATEATTEPSTEAVTEPAEETSAPTEETSAPTEESTAPTEGADPDALTPEGNMELVDDLDGVTEDGKQFITVVTKNGNYFYMCHSRYISLRWTMKKPPASGYPFLQHRRICGMYLPGWKSALPIGVLPMWKPTFMVSGM